MPTDVQGARPKVQPAVTATTPAAAAVETPAKAGRLTAVTRHPQTTNGEKPEAPPHWLCHSDMVAACGVSHQTFANWGVKPVARVGRRCYYLVSDVLANRIARHLAMAKKKPYRLPMKQPQDEASA